MNVSHEVVVLRKQRLMLTTTRRAPGRGAQIEQHIGDSCPHRFQRRVAAEIIRYAQEHDIDLIAMGTHGRGRLKRLILGSVAESAVRDAPCPVLTIHHAERHVSVRPAVAS